MCCGCAVAGAGAPISHPQLARMANYVPFFDGTVATADHLVRVMGQVWMMQYNVSRNAHADWADGTPARVAAAGKAVADCQAAAAALPAGAPPAAVAAAAKAVADAQANEVAVQQAATRSRAARTAADALRQLFVLDHADGAVQKRDCFVIADTAAAGYGAWYALGEFRAEHTPAGVAHAAFVMTRAKLKAMPATVVLSAWHYYGNHRTTFIVDQPISAPHARVARAVFQGFIQSRTIAGAVPAALSTKWNVHVLGTRVTEFV